MCETLISRIEQLAIIQPDKMAVAFKKEAVTYHVLYQKICNIGTILQKDFGVKPGTHVMLNAVSKPETVAAYLGIQYCGGIVVFIDKNILPDNALSIYEDSESILYLTDKPLKVSDREIQIYSLKELYREENKENIIKYELPEYDDIAEILYSTGTTGKPKGVMLSYKAVINILKNTILGIGIQPDDCILVPLPLHHSFALRVLRAVLYQGGTVVLQNGFTFAKEVGNNQTTYNCTGMIGVPTSMELLRSQMQDMFVPIMSKFRYIEISAGSLTVEQRKRLTNQLPNTVIYNTWGSSETGGAIFDNVSETANDPKKVMALGKPLQDIQIKVLDENGKAIQSDENHPGRLALKGDMIMTGYWRREDLNAETFVDGWLLTSDMVYTDEDGYVYMLGRADDIISVGAEKVSPVEIENFASECPGVAECACIGVPDPDEILGQVPALFVVPAESSFSDEKIKKFLADKMERYKLPHEYIHLDKIPRNRAEKIDRKELRKIYENLSDKNLMNPAMENILSRRSIRNFKEDPIPKDKLEMILKAGMYAPSGHNMQTWKFTVIQNKDLINNIKQLIEKVAKEKKVYFYGFENPTCLIMISNDRRNPDGCQDASCAAENMFLAANSYGIGSVWLNSLMTICDEPEIRNMLNELEIPEEHIVWSMAAFGYPVAPGKLLAKKTNVVKYID